MSTFCFLLLFFPECGLKQKQRKRKIVLPATFFFGFKNLQPDNLDLLWRREDSTSQKPLSLLGQFFFLFFLWLNHCSRRNVTITKILYIRNIMWLCPLFPFQIYVNSQFGNFAVSHSVYDFFLVRDSSSMQVYFE